MHAYKPTLKYIASVSLFMCRIAFWLTKWTIPDLKWPPLYTVCGQLQYFHSSKIQSLVLVLWPEAEKYFNVIMITNTHKNLIVVLLCELANSDAYCILLLWPLLYMIQNIISCVWYVRPRKISKSMGTLLWVSFSVYTVRVHWWVGDLFQGCGCHNLCSGQQWQAKDAHS